MSGVIDFAKQEPFMAFLIVSVICGSIVSLVHGRRKKDEAKDD